MQEILDTISVDNKPQDNTTSTPQRTQHLHMAPRFRRELILGYFVKIYVKIRREKLFSASGPMCSYIFFA